MVPSDYQFYTSNYNPVMTLTYGQIRLYIVRLFSESEHSQIVFDTMSRTKYFREWKISERSRDV